MHSPDTDPGPGLLHDHVLPGRQSGHLLRLELNLPLPPLSPLIRPVPQRLRFPRTPPPPPKVTPPPHGHLSYPAPSSLPVDKHSVSVAPPELHHMVCVRRYFCDTFL